MKILLSESLRKMAEEVTSGIGKDEYLEEREKEKSGKTTVHPSKDKDKPYQPAPKIRPPKRQPTFKNEWDSNEKRREYQQEYRLEHGNGYVKKKGNENVQRERFLRT